MNRQAELEANYALATALAGVEGRMTDVVNHLRGLVVNNVLFAGTVVLDATGMWTGDWEVPFGSVAIGNGGSSTLTVTNASASSSAPTSGAGVITVGSGKGASIILAGRELTLYGSPGAVISVGVYDKPLGAAQFGPGSGAGTVTVPAEGDAAASFTGATGEIAHLYGFNGATWDRFRAGSNAADAAATLAAGVQQTNGYSFGFNGATWDRLRTAAGIAAAGSHVNSQAVAGGSAVVLSLNAAAATGAGTPLDNTLGRVNHTLQVTGTGAGMTINFEASLDGATYAAVTPTAVAGAGGTVVGSAATTNGLYTITGAYRYVRANLTAVTSGNVTARIVSA